MAACRPLRLIYGAPQRPISAAAGGRVRDAVDQSVRRPALPTGSQRLPIDPPRAGSPTFPTWSEIPRHAATHTDFVTVETERHHVAREHRAAVTAERAGACGGEMDHGCSNGTSHGMRIKTSEGKKKRGKKRKVGECCSRIRRTPEGKAERAGLGTAGFWTGLTESARHRCSSGRGRPRARLGAALGKSQGTVSTREGLPPLHGQASPEPLQSIFITAEFTFKRYRLSSRRKL